MPQFVSEAMAQVRDEPASGESVTVTLRVANGHLNDAQDWVEAHGGDVLDRVELGLLKVSVAETVVRDICALEYIEAVEDPDETLKVQSPGNTNSLRE